MSKYIPPHKRNKLNQQEEIIPSIDLSTPTTSTILVCSWCGENHFSFKCIHKGTKVEKRPSMDSQSLFPTLSGSSPGLSDHSNETWENNKIIDLSKRINSPTKTQSITKNKSNPTLDTLSSNTIDNTSNTFLEDILLRSSKIEDNHYYYVYYYNKINNFPTESQSFYFLNGNIVAYIVSALIIITMSNEDVRNKKDIYDRDLDQGTIINNY